MSELDTVAAELVAAGMTGGAAEDKARLFHRIAREMNATPSLRLFVPGRVEFLGKHTDYAGGRSLVGAIERGICFAARPRPDHQVVMHDVAGGRTSTFAIAGAIDPPQGTWSRYGMVVARRIERNFPGAVGGADIFFASDLSPAAGMSTSSALITGFFAIFSRLNHLARHRAYGPIIAPEELAGYLGAVENGSSYGPLAGDSGVGTFGGSQDHAALLLSQPGSLLQCSFAPVRLEARVPFPRGLVLAIGVSGVAAEKTGAANQSYNRISRITGRLLEHWNMATGRNDPTLMAAVTSRPSAHLELREILPSASDPEFDSSTLIGRLEQVVMETTVLIPDAVEALRRGHLTALGATVDVSQVLAERMLGNQVPETTALARLARELGAVAASAFGAGFGGSVYAVIPEASAAEFLARWSERYLAQFPHQRERATFFETRLGPPLTVV
jgi:galactokinase